MAGRPQAMARKVTELERTILDLLRRLDTATPATHKKTVCYGGSAGEKSPWVSLYRAGCGLVVAAEALGDHYRRGTDAAKPGPIQETLDEDTLERIRQHATASSGTDKATRETQQLAEALRTVPGGLPDRAGIEQEVAWVAAHMHDPSPVLGDAPSRTSVALLMDLKRDDRLRRDFWTITLTKRLAPGERRQKPKAFAEDQDTVTDDEHDAECMRRLFGDTYSAGSD